MPVQQESSIVELREILQYCADLIRAYKGNNNPVVVSDMLEEITKLDYIKFYVDDDGTLDYVSTPFTLGSSDIPTYEDTVDYYRQLITVVADKLRRLPKANQLLSIDDIREEKCIVQGYNKETGRLVIPQNIKFSKSSTLYTSFDNIPGLKTIVIPNNVDITNIGSLFSYCTGLTNVVLPNNITTIPDNMFENCT